jgi:3-oxoadipate enol-lactonase
VLAPNADPALVDRAIEVMAGKDRAAYRRSNEVLWGADMRTVATTVRVPALVLVGELDRITPPALSEELAGLIPGSRPAVIPGAGHLSNEERPAEFNSAVTAFLDSQRSSIG